MLLAACSNGTPEVGSNFRFEADEIRVFLDGSGVARFEATEDGEVITGYIIAPELATVLDEIEGGSTDVVDNVIDFPVIDTTGTTVIRGGAELIGTRAFDVLVATNQAGDALARVSSNDELGTSFFVTAGTEATNLPQSGTADYRGTLIMGPSGEITSASEYGAFLAEVDFGSGRFDFDGDTDTFTVSGGGTVTSGRLSSDAMDFIVRVGGIPFTVDGQGSLRGDLHGDGGDSVTGVIYSDDAGILNGAFVGERD